MDICSVPVTQAETPQQSPQTSGQSGIATSQPAQPVQQPVVASSTQATPQNEQTTASSTAPSTVQQPPQQSTQAAAPITPQPSSTSSTTSPSTARMPSHISSPVTTTSLIQPSVQTSLGAAITPHTPIISTAPQTSISQAQVQVPVSAHVSQNNAHHQATQHMSNLASQMSVAVSQIPQVQVIQQPPATYHLQQLYHPPGQQMFLQPGNLTIQNMPAFQSTSGGLQLQLPTNATGQVPISSVNNKTPIVSKGLALSSISSNIGTHQTQMISSLKTGLNPGGTQMIKPVLPSHQFATANSHQIVISPYGTVLPQPQQTLLPANKTVLESQKGKQFMLSHGTTIQPKSPILPTTAMTSQFKAQLSANQLITQASPATMITNQAQILSSFPALPQGLTWAAAPAQSLMSQNSSPIFIRGGQPDIGFLQTSSPQIQAVSGNPIYVNPNGGTMQVVQTSQTGPGTSAIPHTFISTTSTSSSHINSNATTTTQSLSISAPTQHPPIAPAPPTPVTQAAIRPKPLRPANSVGTQTAPSTTQQKVSSDVMMLKPIAAKTKPTVVSKSSATSQTTMKAPATVVSTQTVSHQQQTTESVVQPQQKSLNEVGLKTNALKSKPSVGQKSSTAAQTAISKTASVNTQTASQPTIQNNSLPQTVPQPIPPASTSTQASTPSATQSTPQPQQQQQQKSGQSQTKSISKEKHSASLQTVPNPQPKPEVEKKDASTEQDCDLMGLCGMDLLKSAPQKAIVKPQVLTHVIDGYIIHESPNPFPVNGKYSEAIGDVSGKQEDNPFAASNSLPVTTNGIEPKGKPAVDVIECSNCGKTVPKSKSKTKKGKRFCSVACGKQFQMKSTKLGLFNPVKSSLAEFDISSIESNSAAKSASDSSHQSEVISGDGPEDRKRMKMSKRLINSQSTVDTVPIKTDTGSSKMDFVESNGESTSCDASVELTNGGDDTSNSNASIAGVYIPTGGKNPIKWSVQDVYDFVKNLPGCQEYADEFRSQEIDGQALMLLKEDHLMSAMSMKLGPALKICSKINALREKADNAKPV